MYSSHGIRNPGNAVFSAASIAPRLSATECPDDDAPAALDRLSLYHILPVSFDLLLLFVAPFEEWKCV